MAEASGNDQQFINKLTETILANLENEHFGVNELVKQSAISHYALLRRLQAITGKNINQFIRETRLLKALELLQKEEMTATEVAYKTGFGSATYFNTCFTDYFGYPPGAVKKGEVKINGKLHDPLSNPSNAKIRKKWYITASLIFGLNLILILFYAGDKLIFKNNHPEGGNFNSGLEKSIAILPFKNLSDSASNQYFIDGIMEEILTDLSNLQNLRVVSKTSVEQFRENSIPVSEIAKILNVDFVVEGSGQKSGNNLQIRIQLIDVKADKHIWTESYKLELKDAEDLFRLQSNVAKSIANELSTNISPEEKIQIEKVGTMNLSAYDFYLRGKNEMQLSLETPDPKHRENSHEMFKKALYYDSTYAPAYFGLAKLLLYSHPENYLTDNYLDSIKYFADKAILYDNKFADAYNIRGVYFIGRGDTENALQDFRKVLQYDSNNQNAYYNIGKFIYMSDRSHQDFVKGIENLEKAASLYKEDDLPFYLRNLGYAYGNFAGFKDIAIRNFQSAFDLFQDTLYYYINMAQTEMGFGNYEKAIEYLLKNYPEDTPFKETRSTIAKCYYMMGKYKDALKYTEEYTAYLKQNNRYQSQRGVHWIGSVYHFNGNKTEADYWFEILNQDLIKNSNPERQYALNSIAYFYDWACLFAYKGDKEKTMESLEKILQARVFPLSFVNMIIHQPLFDFISEEAEYDKIIKEIQIRYVSEHERVKKWLEENDRL
jgi:TolB-like protein/AraC-like DNA-binding protein/Tfp pilus assembly protein PilF